jgi:hypothetical protein
VVGNTYLSTEVIPLRDVAGTPMPFEKSFPTAAADYGPTSTAFTPYICAWGPSDTVRPKMIRITMTLTDPLGRLPNGQTFEYVFSLP